MPLNHVNDNDWDKIAALIRTAVKEAIQEILLQEKLNNPIAYNHNFKHNPLLNHVEPYTGAYAKVSEMAQST